MKTFEEIGIKGAFLQAISEIGFENPMPIQEKVIPHLLNSHKDIIALAQTGTGKTAAFGLPLLAKIDTSLKGIQCLILSPTRELCSQIADDLKQYAKYTRQIQMLAIYGGASIPNQIRDIKRGVHILVATPGRLIDLKNRGIINFDDVKNVVLDEADEMLNMGFRENIDEILASIPKERNIFLFSATMSRGIEKIAKTYLHDYDEIVVGSRNEGAENVNHIYYMVQARYKYLALKRIVDYYPHIFAIVFCRTKAETQEIADKLIRDGYNAEALHGDLSQQQRDLTMQKFKQHLTQLLIATDVAARGLDVEQLTHVINYGLPDDIENYTHRSGRTGRAGKKGTSISIIHTKEHSKIRNIEREIGKKFVENTLPNANEICTKQLYKAMDEIDKIEVNEEEIAPFMDDINRRFSYMDKEELIKKIVSLEFGKFLSYYANAPEIPAIIKDKRKNESKSSKSGRNNKTTIEKGFSRLFLNLGKSDGFYPAEIMQFVNQYIKGRQIIGHIDLFQRHSHIEVPEKDAQNVINALNGVSYKRRKVKCYQVFETTQENLKKQHIHRKKTGDQRNFNSSPNAENSNNWNRFPKTRHIELKGKKPDFEEEGWARRHPKH